MSTEGLFGVIARLQGDTSWGSMLDAGTGVRSAQWIASLPTDRWTAVSADAAHLEETARAVAASRRPQDRLILGNWADNDLLAGEVHDTVLAEYLLGAMEPFAPYRQQDLFARLRPLIGRRLYVLGVDPYVVGRAATPGGAMVQEIGRFRDACFTLGGGLPYREFPAEWVIDRLEQAGLRITFAQRFPNAYTERWVEDQFRSCRAPLACIEDTVLAGTLRSHAAKLRRRALATIRTQGALRQGHDYLIAAEA